MSASVWAPGSNNIPLADPNSQLTSQEFTASAGQTDFTLTEFTYNLNSNALDIYINGVKQPKSSITEVSNSVFRTNSPCEAGDFIEAVGNTESVDAEGSATDAAAARDAALAAQAAAEAALDAMTDLYLGAYPADPTTDNDGNPLLSGALYYNTVEQKLKVYDASNGSWSVGVDYDLVNFYSTSYSGTDVQTDFVLPAAAANSDSVFVFISGIEQKPGIDFTATGTTLSFVVAPPSGVDNISVRVIRTITLGVLANDVVTTDNLQDGSVTTPKIASLAVTTAKIADDAVTADKIAAGAVGASEIADGAVGTDEIANSAVTSAKIDPAVLALISSGSTLVGEIKAYASTVIPTGYLECNGQEVAAEDTALNAVLAGAYGVGVNGRSLVPNLRGAFPRGFDNGQGRDAGRVWGTYQADEFKAHNHTYTAPYQKAPQSGSSTWCYFTATTATTSTAGTADETRPKNVTVVYIIKK